MKNIRLKWTSAPSTHPLIPSLKREGRPEGRGEFKLQHAVRKLIVSDYIEN